MDHPDERPHRSRRLRVRKRRPAYLTRHRIRTGKQTLRIIVSQEPSRAGVDPNRKLIERERGDNVVDIGTGS